MEKLEICVPNIMTSYCVNRVRENHNGEQKNSKVPFENPPNNLARLLLFQSFNCAVYQQRKSNIYLVKS